MGRGANPERGALVLHRERAIAPILILRRAELHARLFVGLERMSMRGQHRLLPNARIGKRC